VIVIHDVAYLARTLRRRPVPAAYLAAALALLRESA
jgi:hypothetical protein